MLIKKLNRATVSFAQFSFNPLTLTVLDNLFKNIPLLHISVNTFTYLRLTQQPYGR